MKVGELVELSAYGKRLKSLARFELDVGLLIGKNIVMWSSVPGFKCPVNSRDIKRLSSK